MEEYTEKQQGVLMAYDWIIEKLDAIFDFAESELGSGCEAIDNLVVGVGEALKEKVQLFGNRGNQEYSYEKSSSLKLK